MEITRYYDSILTEKLKPNKVLVLLGARRVGKTKLIEKLIKNSSEKILFLNGDDIETHQILETQSATHYKKIIGNHTLLVIDEAQEIPSIGMKLKLMVDSIEGLKILITGSSALEINNQTGEPLVGRMSTYNLFPIAQIEFATNENFVITQSNLGERLVYGSYPELLHLPTYQEKMKYLKEMVSNQLLRDILAFEGIKKRDKIIALLQIVALRVGTELSLESIGKELQISKNTVEKYLDLFSKVFIIYQVSGFSKNRENEITKKKKWYFVDNGLRNAIINDFRAIDNRQDLGMLWENYLNSERKKMLEYKEIDVLEYFWRTHSQQEIDRIEVRNNKISAFEFKWSDENAKIPFEFAKSYPNANFNIIHRGNYLDFIV